MAWSNMVSLELDDEDREDAAMPIAMPDTPQFPYGTRYCLTQVELEKLGLDHAECDVGDVIDMRSFGVITSKSVTEGEYGECVRIEVQMERMAIENETTEETPEAAPEPRASPARHVSRYARRRLQSGKDYAKEVE